jgi:hypothetical protein
VLGSLRSSACIPLAPAWNAINIPELLNRLVRMSRYGISLRRRAPIVSNDAQESYFHRHIPLILAAIGIYGLMSYSVEQQTQELGIRIALGAGKEQVLKLIVGQGMLPVGIGVVTGLAIAFGVTRLLTSLLYGVKPSDPLTFGAVAVVLSLVAVLAIYIPARRAMGVDPLLALRNE